MQDHAAVQGDKFGMRQSTVHSCAYAYVTKSGLNCSQMLQCSLLLIVTQDVILQLTAVLGRAGGTAYQATATCILVVLRQVSVAATS